MERKALTDTINLFISGEVFVPCFVHSHHSSIAQEPRNLPEQPSHFFKKNCVEFKCVKGTASSLEQTIQSWRLELKKLRT